MIDYKIVLGCMALIATVVQYATYIQAVLKRKTHPHVFTWFIWGLPSGIIFAAQFFNGGGAGTWATALTTILSIVVFILSFFYGEKTITKLDWACLFIALFSMLLWVITQDSLASVVLITFVDLIGFIPTIRKSIKKPHQETLTTYIVAGLKWTFSLCAMSNLTLTIFLYPIAMLLANWGFVLILMTRRKLISNQYLSTI